MNLTKMMTTEVIVKHLPSKVQVVNSDATAIKSFAELAA